MQKPRDEAPETGPLVKSSRLEELITPLLLDIGILISISAWILTVPMFPFPRYRVWILSYDDLSAILWVGILLVSNSYLIYVYKHAQFLSKRLFNATKLILLVGDTFASFGLVGSVFQLPKTFTVLPAQLLSTWSLVIIFRFLGNEEQRTQFFKGLHDRSISIRVFGRIRQKIKIKLGEPHYH